MTCASNVGERASLRGPLSVVGLLLSFTYLYFFYVSRPQFPARVRHGNLVFFHFSFLWKERPLVWGRSYRIRDLGTRGRWPCPAQPCILEPFTSSVYFN
jgi:hypothetical protein